MEIKQLIKLLEENQEKLTELDVKFFLDKINETEYKKQRENLRQIAKKLILENKDKISITTFENHTENILK